jgi:hypothetical protein
VRDIDMSHINVAVRPVTTHAKPSARASTVISAVRGRFMAGEIAVCTAPVPHQASSIPMMPPRLARNDALHQKLTNQAAAGGAERPANGELRLPRDTPADREIGNVRTRDEQQQRDCAEEDGQHWTYVAHRGFEKRQRLDAPVAAVGWELFFDFGRRSPTIRLARARA